MTSNKINSHSGELLPSIIHQSTSIDYTTKKVEIGSRQGPPRLLTIAEEQKLLENAITPNFECGTLDPWERWSPISGQPAWENNGGSFLLDITLRFYWNHCSNQHSRGYCTLNSGFPLCLNSVVPSTPEQCMVWHKTQKSTLCAACAASKIIHPMHISPGKQ